MTPKVAAILLAAGKSTRMGCCKQLLPLGDTTVIGRCLSTLHAAGITETMVVVSETGVEVAAAASLFPVTVVINRDAGGDMASSFRAGLEELSPDVSGVLVALADYPLVKPSTVSSLLSQHAELPGKIILPVHEGRRGHPLIFPRRILADLDHDMTLRDLVRLHSLLVYHASVDDSGILRDMDTPDDYSLICNILSGGGPAQLR